MDGDKQRGFVDTTLPALVERALIVQAIVILLLMWSYAGWRIRADQAETLDAARHELGAVAAGMYVHMQAVLNDSLGAARAAAQAIDANGDLDSITIAQASELMSRELSSGDYVRGLFLIGDARFISVARDRRVQSSDGAPAWFDVAAQRQGTVHIGATIPDPMESSQRAIPISVRTVDGTGRVVWAGALLGVEALDQLYESLAIRDGVLSLTSTRGDILLRVPPLPQPEVSINLVEAPVFREAAELPSSGGFLEGPSPVVGGTWIYAVRGLGAYRMAVSAGRDKQGILAPWRARTRSLIYVLGAVSLLFVALTGALKHFMERVERANTNLAKLNSELETRVTARTAELQDANEQLALTNQELEAFTASASHDLRSPLGAIAGQAGLLRDELQASLSDTMRQRFERIQANVTRCADIVDGLLSLARISRESLLNERVDLSTLARSIVDELQQQQPGRDVQCAIQPDLIVNADPRLMKSLLANLLGNAWKYTSKTAHARIELACSDAPDAAVFSVRDNGAGFDMAGAERIFEPFHRLHSAAEFPGVGIGLATVARIVHRYAGKVTVDSAPGRGTTFRFTLPNAAV
jgi:signal transduction histidine kinase